ncbi:MAG: YceI family protein [Pirellulaceae bacterium]|nr:YceI family protein [Pirellulaceae bacterium]
MRCSLICLAVVAFVGSSWSALLIAQDVKTPAATVQPAEVQTEVSRIYVFVDKKGLGHQHGVEAKLSASSLLLGAKENAGKLVFDMTSFNADTPVARKYVGLAGTTDEGTRTAVNENMKGAAVLDVRRFPTASFDVTSAKATGRTSAKGLPLYQLEGQFTLHGRTRPLSIPVDVEQVRGWLHVKGVFTIKQTEYGIKPYSKGFGAIGVGDELRIYGDLIVAPSEHVNLQDIPVRP